MSQYMYFPANYRGRIKALLLDANITGHLDLIAERGSSYRNSVVRDRMADLVSRLDDDVMVMAGLGAAESVIRRGKEPREVSNFHRRSANAVRLLSGDRAGLPAWLSGNNTAPAPSSFNGNEYADRILDADFVTVRDNFIVPSYAVVLKAYQLYVERQTPLDSLKILEAFAEELFGRGSRELMLGALLLAGNSTGRETALNIMKLREEKNFESTMNALWNTSFDLTYSRVATMPSLPEMLKVIPQPAVFVTDDKHLGKLLRIVQPMGAIAMLGGGHLTADYVSLKHLIRDDLFDDLAVILRCSAEKARRDRTDVRLVHRIRWYKSHRYVEQIEEWFARRYGDDGATD